jgi:endonuclease/exonuclease/phosphatase (EEP) superfamily protein YafD
MRFKSLFSSLLVTLVLTASAAAQQAVSDHNHNSGLQKPQPGQRCDTDKLVQNDTIIADDDVQGLNPARITVLNWNIYKGQRENWAEDFKRYSYKHDVILIQEAYLREDLKSILQDGHQHWALNAAFDYEDSVTGVMTASLVKPLSLCGQRATEPLIRFPKTSLVSYYPIAGMKDNLLVANIHGINFTLGVDAYQQQLDSLYRLMKQHTGPIVFAGDFNTWSAERMQIVKAIANSLSLESLDYTNHNRTSMFGNALDHVFYRGLQPVEHDTWHVTSSDHNPTRVSFRVKDAVEPDTSLAASESDEDNC